MYLLLILTRLWTLLCLHSPVKNQFGVSLKYLYSEEQKDSSFPELLTLRCLRDCMAKWLRNSLMKKNIMNFVIALFTITSQKYAWSFPGDARQKCPDKSILFLLLCSVLQIPPVGTGVLAFKVLCAKAVTLNLTFEKRCWIPSR